MSWQEDLQQLDTALAGGQISADDYRRRRDEVLAKASGGVSGAQVPPAQPMGQPTAQPSTPPPGIPQPQPSQGYFPPPFRWQATPPQQQQQPVNPAEETQTMHPVTGQPDAERTQVVPGQGDRTQVVQGRPGDPTQVVHGQNSGGYNAQYYTPQQDSGAWGGPDSTPWGGGEFPPLGATGNWGVKQGPEVFEAGGNGKSRRVLAIVGIVVVLALIGGGIWWFTIGNKGSNQPNQNTNSTTTQRATTTTPAGPKPPLAGLAGRLDTQASGPTNVQESEANHMFGQSEAQLMTDCGATTGYTETLFEDTWLTQVHVFTCSNASLAQSAASALLAKQAGFGYRAVAGPNGTQVMLAEGLKDVANVPVDERFFYTAGKTLVRIEVRGHDTPATNQGMAEVVNTISTNYPGK